MRTMNKAHIHANDLVFNVVIATFLLVTLVEPAFAQGGGLQKVNTFLGVW